jgi:AcrR family transcriptional regulator
MGEKTQQLILDAAFAEFAHHGFQKTSLKDIAAHAGVSRPTVYSFFKTKTKFFAVSPSIFMRMVCVKHAALPTKPFFS